MQLKNITLLSKDEYTKYQSLIPNTDHWWWLKTQSSLSGAKDYVFVVDQVGELRHCSGFYYGGVRPLCVFAFESTDPAFWYKPKKLVGSKIQYGQYNLTILSAGKGEIHALCDEAIARHYFDKNTSVWETSELKRWLATEGFVKITV